MASNALVQLLNLERSFTRTPPMKVGRTSVGSWEVWEILGRRSMTAWMTPSVNWTPVACSGHLLMRTLSSWTNGFMIWTCKWNLIQASKPHYRRRKLCCNTARYEPKYLTLISDILPYTNTGNDHWTFKKMIIIFLWQMKFLIFKNFIWMLRKKI